MPAKFERMAPILPVRDVAAALEHYERLGFGARAYEEEDEHGPFYGYIERDGIQAHLTRCQDLDPRTNMSACYLYVDDADALHHAWQQAGVAGRLHAPCDTEYGLREFAHVDPDGNLWRIGSRLGGA